MVDPLSVSIGAMAVLGLLGASAFFSSTEIAVFSLPDDWTPETGDDSHTRALATLRGNPHRLLVTLLVGNNIANVALSVIVTVGVAGLLPPGQAVAVSTLLASTIVLVFGEIIPKSFGLGHAEGWALTAARPLVLVGAVLYPVVAVFDVLTRRLGALVGGSQAIEQPYVD